MAAEPAHRVRGEILSPNDNRGASLVWTGRRADFVHGDARVVHRAKTALAVHAKQVVPVVVENEHPRRVDVSQPVFRDFARNRVAVHHGAGDKTQRRAEGAVHLVPRGEPGADDCHGAVGVARDRRELGCCCVLVRGRRREGRPGREIALDPDVQDNKTRRPRRGDAPVLVVRYPRSRDVPHGSETAVHVVHFTEKVPRHDHDVAALTEPASGVRAGHDWQVVEHEVRAHQRFRRRRRRRRELKRGGDRFVCWGFAQHKGGGDENVGAVSEPEPAQHAVEQQVLPGHKQNASPAFVSNLGKHRANLHRFLRLHHHRVTGGLAVRQVLEILAVARHVHRHETSGEGRGDAGKKRAPGFQRTVRDVFPKPAPRRLRRVRHRKVYHDFRPAHRGQCQWKHRVHA